VFGAEINEKQSVSVMEGDSVTLHTGVTEICKEDDVQWKFRDKKSLKAKMNKTKQTSYTFDDVPDERFRDRLKLDNQTGSLIITNTTTEHTGVYQLEINGVKMISKTFNVSVYGE